MSVKTERRRVFRETRLTHPFAQPGRLTSVTILIAWLAFAFLRRDQLVRREGPTVRIRFPPAESQVRTCLSREFAFLRREAAVSAGVRAGASGAGLDGHLRAYSAEDGRIVWDVDTKMEYRTVNGVAARGGSIDGPGAVVVGGTLYVSSGYSFFGTLPGNVLLAYSVDGR